MMGEGMKRTRILLFGALLLFVGLLAGCDTEKFIITYNRPAKLDVDPRIKKVAIVGFKQKEDYGDLVIGKLNGKIRKSERFKIIERENLSTIMKEKDLIEADLAEVGVVRDMKLDKVDAIITGKVRAMTQQVDYNDTRYRIQNVGGYPVPVPYTVRIKVPVHELSLEIRMIDLTRKGRIVYGQSYSKSFHSKKDKKLINKIREKRRQKGVTPAGVFETLIEDCVDDFVSYIIPHEISIKVKLMKGSKFVNTGVTFLKANNVDDAEEWFDMALQKDPNAVAPNYNLAVCYEVAGKFSQAIKLYKRCIILKEGEHTASAEGISRIKEEMKVQEETRERENM